MLDRLIYRWLNLLEHYKISKCVIDFSSNKVVNDEYQKSVIGYVRNLSGKINRYFCQFLELLEQPMNSFMCCTNPEIVTLDGIVLSIEAARIRDQKLTYPWIAGVSRSRFYLTWYYNNSLGLQQERKGVSFSLLMIT